MLGCNSECHRIEGVDKAIERTRERLDEIKREKLSNKQKKESLSELADEQTRAKRYQLERTQNTNKVAQPDVKAIRDMYALVRKY